MCYLISPQDKILGSPRVENRISHRDLTGTVPQYIQVSLLFTTGRCYKLWLVGASIGVADT